MRLALTSGRTRRVVLAAHVLALVGGVAFAGSQASQVLAERSALVEAEEAQRQLVSRLADLQGARPAALAEQPPDPFLQGRSAAAAAADLQDRVVSAIRTAGGTVTSSQADTTGTGAAPPSVLLTVDFQLGMPALQRLLFGLEGNAPALFVDQLSVDAGEAGGRNPGAGDGPLRVSMTVSGYWNGSP